MPVPPRVLPRDVEWGKRHDSPRRMPVDNSMAIEEYCSWLFTRGPLRIRRKRILPLVLVVLLLYYILSHVVSAVTASLNSINTSSAEPGLWVSPPNRPSSNRPGSAEYQKHDYNGPINFQKLASSIQAVSRSGRFVNRNVLFATASLKSAATLIPMACEMARWRRNDVHFVLVGRDELPFSEILAVNHVSKECDVSWHDARPDLSRFSSDTRFEFAVQSAFDAMHYAVRPHAIILDSSDQEEPTFLRIAREKTRILSMAAVEIPSGGKDKMSWVTRLDYGALSAWRSATVELLIHAPLNSSGSLIRLLKSLQRADYFSHPPPRLTIELPTRTDESLKQFLDSFQWPPNPQGPGQANSELVLRHHIPHKGVPADELSTRFLESFYPKSPGFSNVLLLSPHAELSPLYFHYTKYTLLEYKYSAYSFGASANILGISLEVPTKSLNGTTFNPPSTLISSSSAASTTSPAPSPSRVQFLWQAPNANAALYFGDKWTELHAFLADRFDARRSSTTTTTTTKPKKLISRDHPAWTEFLLEFMRARGYWLLYPAFRSDLAIAKVHKELYQRPEEYYDTSIQDADDDEGDGNADSSAYLASSGAQEAKLTTESVLTSVLPADGDLPVVSDLVMVTHAGEIRLDAEAAEQDRRRYVGDFRAEIGGCKGGQGAEGDSLFCLGDEEKKEG